MNTPCTILCIDDDSFVLSVLKDLLESEGYRVLATTCHSEALTLLDTAPPFACCICDYQMPGIRGDEFLRLVAARSPDTVRILLSGYAANTHIHQAQLDGTCSAFVQKPFFAAELLSALTRHHRKQPHTEDCHATVT